MYFLIILSPTHNHASLEMSDEPEGLPVRDEVASIVTMLHVTCYVKASPDLVIASPQEKQILHYASTGMQDFVRFLVEWYKAAISSTFPPVSPKVKPKC